MELELQEKTPENYSQDTASKAASETKGFYTSETRSYQLNRDKSLHKKLEATELSDLSVIQTRGGLKIQMNCGMYELFRVAARNYYSSETMGKNTTHTAVIDRDQNHVETKYRVVTSKSAHYTMNMYHTKSAMLINGKGTTQFIESDMPDILSSIEVSLADNNCSMADFNHQIRSAILKCSEQDTASSDRSVNALSCPDTVDRQMGENNISSTDSPIITEIDDPALPSELTCEKEHSSNQNIENTKSSDSHSDISTDVSDLASQNEYPNLVQTLRDIHTNLSIVQHTLSSHILDTQCQFERLCDEVVSLKKQMSQRSNNTDSDIETVSQNVNVVQTDMQKFSVSIHRKIQSISDQIKQLSSNTSKHMQQPVTEQTQQTKAANKTEKRSTSPATNRTRPKKTVIIGDSIIRNINPRGLTESVSVNTIAGGKICHAETRLTHWNFEEAEKVILYIGGNDAASDASIEGLYKTFKSGIIRVKNKFPHCKIFVCTICSRRDCDVNPVNNMIVQLAKEMNASIIDCYKPFVYGDGSPVHAYFHRDGIHLSQKGTSALITIINKTVNITKKNSRQDPPSQYKWCSHCKMTDHNTNECERSTSNNYDTRNGYHVGSNNTRLSSKQTTPIPGPNHGRWCDHCHMANHSTEECGIRFQASRNGKTKPSPVPNRGRRCDHCHMANHSTEECGIRARTTEYPARRRPPANRYHMNDKNGRWIQWCPYCKLNNHSIDNCSKLAAIYRGSVCDRDTKH